MIHALVPTDDDINLYLDTKKIRNYDLLLLVGERLHLSNRTTPLNKLLSMADLVNLLRLKHVSLAIVCHSVRYDDN